MSELARNPSIIYTLGAILLKFLYLFIVQQLIMLDPYNRKSCSVSKPELSYDLVKTVSQMRWIKSRSLKQAQKAKENLNVAS